MNLEEFKIENPNHYEMCNEIYQVLETSLPDLDYYPKFLTEITVDYLDLPSGKKKDTLSFGINLDTDKYKIIIEKL